MELKIVLLIIKYKLNYLIPIVFSGILFLCIGLSCSPKPPTEGIITEDYTSFDQYWYQGKAEITSYELSQARYGELHKGNALLVFVTEPFSKSKQVKLDNTNLNPSDVVNILKLNFSKKFTTGIYDYSILQSIFTPVDLKTNPHTLKTTTSVQEWCGHAFTQLNLQENQYQVSLKSYFESEGDQEFKIEQALLEDELFNLIRIAPNNLPVGTISLIPSIIIARLKHLPIQVEQAEASLKEHLSDKKLMTYSIVITTSKRRVAIHYHKKFPHEIEGWEETYLDGEKELTTTAIRKKTILSDYWNQHHNANLPLRKELGLD